MKNSDHAPDKTLQSINYLKIIEKKKINIYIYNFGHCFKLFVIFK